MIIRSMSSHQLVLILVLTITSLYLVPIPVSASALSTSWSTGTSSSQSQSDSPIHILLTSTSPKHPGSHHIPRLPNSNIDKNPQTPKRRAKSDYTAHSGEDLVCRPFGECEPCPEDERQQPFCLPFGNRRLLHCIPSASHDSPYDEENSGSQSPGEVPAWEACGKVIKQERHDFWEFVTANVLFLMVALTILWARSSALATAQYRQLAARIGIPGSTWRA